MLIKSFGSSLNYLHNHLHQAKIICEFFSFTKLFIIFSLIMLADFSFCWYTLHFISLLLFCIFQVYFFVFFASFVAIFPYTKLQQKAESWGRGMCVCRVAEKCQQQKEKQSWGKGAFRDKRQQEAAAKKFSEISHCCVKQKIHIYLSLLLLLKLDLHII